VSFEDTMKKVFDTANTELAPSAPVVETPAAPVTPAAATPPPDLAAKSEPSSVDRSRDEQGRFASAPTPTQSTTPPAVPTPVSTAPAAPAEPSKLELALERLAHAQAQQAQMWSQMQEASRPRVEAPPPPKPPTVDEALADFRVPMQRQGEDAAAYDRRVQAEVMDHLFAKQREFARQEARGYAREEAQRVQQQIIQERQVAEANRRYESLLDEAAVSGGYQAGTPSAQFARAYIDRTLSAAHAAGITQGWGEREWRQATAAVAKEFASFHPPPPKAGAAPALSVVAGGGAPPISAGGGQNTVPGTPPQPQASKPRGFDAAMANVFEEAQRALR